MRSFASLSRLRVLAFSQLPGQGQDVDARAREWGVVVPSTIRQKCAELGLVGGAYYVAMSAYQDAGPITAEDRGALDALVVAEDPEGTEADQRAYLTTKYGPGDIVTVGYADYLVGVPAE